MFAGRERSAGQGCAPVSLCRPDRTYKHYNNKHLTPHSTNMSTRKNSSDTPLIRRQCPGWARMRTITQSCSGSGQVTGQLAGFEPFLISTHESQECKAPYHSERVRSVMPAVWKINLQHNLNIKNYVTFFTHSAVQSARAWRQEEDCLISKLSPSASNSLFTAD